jgi:alpha-L-fucosidase
MQHSSPDTSWFNQARYGMFIHWGAYSVAARGEWVMNRERIPLDEYRRLYVDRFTAEHFDPEQWVALAKAAGMKYMVLTTRHHDGFALWDTATRDFNSAKMGPKRDLVRQYVEAVRRGGLKVGLYYSGADWTHPDYPGAFERDWPTGWPDETQRKRFIEYYRQQVRELMTSYGKIDILWYDGCIPKPLDGDATNAMVRQLQPHILINSRLGKQDIVNSEQAIVPPKDPNVLWEACMTLNDNWGYHAGDQNWKTPRQVVRMLAETAKGGGNLLLNVGPRGDGTIPEPSQEILRTVGGWLKCNGEFLAGSQRSPFTWSTSGMVTVKGSTVYLHLLHSPGREFCYAEIKNRVLAARLVDGNRPLTFRQDGPRLHLSGLPEKPDPIATTIAIEVEGTPEPCAAQKTFWIPGSEY